MPHDSPNVPPAADTPLPVKERILTVAHDLFYRDGIRATGIDRVIAESSVAKASFYRHFPAKHDLVLAYLEYRHQNWMQWFRGALLRHGAPRRGAAALPPALAEWLEDAGYRGCAFINAVGELGPTEPAICALARRHKQEMAAEIEALLPAGRGRSSAARSLAMAVDGAIVQAQADGRAEEALQTLRTLTEAVLRAMPTSRSASPATAVARTRGRQSPAGAGRSRS